MQLVLDHKFDQKTGRHFINDTQIVFHCHHFTTLYTQLAIDAGKTALLANVAEENFLKILTDYYKQHGIESLDDKIEIACQYYSAIGLGTLEVCFIGKYSGEVKSANSHIEMGWIKKWSKYDKSVNYIGCGYVAAMFSAIFDNPLNSFHVEETKSIVKGDEYTMFKVVKN
ncbi:MAG: hypothetical protein A2W98_13180 [Bacteroidetes bacterium GWF2_33_38]|nr:MAG: hypothetical protein A2W98_13180 [Bacteroidetes bacterium GWF2_33_38]OFY72978.1 MAG: hypothetical protein A2265_06680 [Bacteroidetes bacterium RIFOXYA12_FULL_33_9]